MNHPKDFASQAAVLVARMSREEKAAFVSGGSFWTTGTLDRLGLDQPAVMSDGPIGLRKQADAADHLGLGGSLPATCFPAGVNLGSTWDRALMHELASALADECLDKDVSVILGPAMNMKRSPLCGRNFEYFSEDPYLTGELATAYVKGAQAKGIGTSVKHFAANNQEYGRMRVDTRVDERTLRELYLPAFERVVLDAQPWTVMSAYNQINGAYCSENEWLLETVLRKEWGFAGAVISDWGAVKDRVTGVASGLDLEMPTSGTHISDTSRTSRTALTYLAAGSRNADLRHRQRPEAARCARERRPRRGPARQVRHASRGVGARRPADPIPKGAAPPPRRAR